MNKSAKWSVIGVGVTIMVVLLALFLLPVYSRYQARQDAANQVKVTHTHIENAEEEAKVNHAQIQATKAEAQKRYQEAIGLKRAQDEVRKTLTPLYVQHEYVEALEDIAHSESNTIEFIPVGPNGIPIVGSNNITPQEISGEE